LYIHIYIYTHVNTAAIYEDDDGDVTRIYKVRLSMKCGCKDKIGSAKQSARNSNLQNNRKEHIGGMQGEDCRSWHLNTNRWENETEGVQKRDGKPVLGRGLKHTDLINIIGES
jgi:hypothetical protein